MRCDNSLGQNDNVNKTDAVTILNACYHANVI